MELKDQLDEGYRQAPAVARLAQLKSLSGTALLEVAGDRAEDVDVRCAALRLLERRRTAVDKRIELALQIVADGSAAPSLRREALRVAGAILFHPSLYAEWRPGYLTALRDAAQAADAELRVLALEKLAAEKDQWALSQLRRAIDAPQDALVPLAEAIGLLAYDVKADLYPSMQRIVDESDDEAAREQALRLLVAGGESAKQMERIIRDKTEPARIRRIAAAGLRSLDENRLRAIAKRIALDKGDDPEVRAASFAALSTLEGKDDAELITRATKLVEQANLKKPLGKGAMLYLQSRGPSKRGNR